MKLWLVWLVLPLLRGQELPEAARQVLDKQYPGWRLAEVAPQIEEWFRGYKFHYRPNLLAADFDGDGREDYAVEIRIPSDAKNQFVLALMRRGAGYEHYLLSKDVADPFVFLLLYEKGSKDFDFAAGKPFRYAHDACGVMYFDHTPVVYMYRRGKFQRKLTPSDEEQ
jgi:hypothetical protein